MLIVDEKYSWIGYGNGIGDWDSTCRLRIYSKDGVDFVLYSNNELSFGRTRTYSIEHLATLVTRDYNLLPKTTKFFDAEFVGNETASFYEITFKIEDRDLIHPALWNIPGKKYGECKWILSNPKWHVVTVEEFENLVREKVKK